MKIPPLSRLFVRKPRDTGRIAVCPAEYGVYLAKVEFLGAMPKVVRCEYHEIGMVSAEALAKLRREAGIDDQACTTLLAPGEYQMLLVEAPNVPANELKTAIRWKIKDNLNHHIDDATVDVLQIPAGKYGLDRAQSLYAIAAANVTIQQRIELFEKARLWLDVIDIPETAQRNVAALFEEGAHAVALLAFNDYGGLLTFTAGGELFLARRLEVSIGQLLDANENLREQYRDRIELELQRSLDYFDRQYNHIPISRVLISAPGDSGLADFLASVVDAKVEKMDLAQVLDISAVPALADSEFAARALTALGAALRRETRVR